MPPSAEYRFAQRTRYRQGVISGQHSTTRSVKQDSARPLLPSYLPCILLYGEVSFPAKELAVAAAGILECANFV